MISLSQILAKYPRISLATPEDQDKIQDLLERTHLRSGGVQIGFDRRPDFFTFLRNQGPTAYVFLMSNENGDVHGLACLTIRPYQEGTHLRSLVYASDLRTTPQLSRIARRQWRDMYAEVIRCRTELIELQNPAAVLTAVWDANEMAQRALIRKDSKIQVQYLPLSHYQVVSVLGRWRRSKALNVRRAIPEDRDVIFQWVCGKSSFTWNHEEFLRTLRQLGKTPEDFLILENSQQPTTIKAIALPVASMPGRKVVLQSLPQRFHLIRKALRWFRGIDVQMGQELKAQNLLFFRTDNSLDAPQALSEFIHQLMNSEISLPGQDRTHLISVSLLQPAEGLWGALLRKGLLTTALHAKIYAVTSKDELNPVDQQASLDALEIGLL